MGHVAVRIRRCETGWLVIGRRTSIECATFEQAWEASIPYFAGRVR